MKKRFNGTSIAGLFAGCFCALALSLPVSAAEMETAPVSAPKSVVITNNKMDSEELLEGFMHSQATFKTSPTAKNSKRRASLGTLNGIIYDALKDGIINIANGNQASSVFKVEIPVKAILGDKWKDSYTAADLGVSTLITDDGNLTKEALNAIHNLLGYNVTSVVDALSEDFPYEMYWFGNEYFYSYFNCKYDSKAKSFICLLENDTITIQLYVSADYSTSDQPETTDVNTAKCKAVKNAADNANQIISENAGKNDYEKLKAYHDKICALTDYDYNAMVESNHVPYGNPWQMIYVFDGNPSTKVVCEGYSKAFKYLCDGSTFQSKLIECHIVTGYLTDLSGAHMWNNIRMNDGKFYLVDVTNDDYDPVKYWLFLVGGNYLDANWIQPNNVDSEKLRYCYDDATLSEYSKAELTWSTTNYVQGTNNTGSATITLDANGGSTTTSSIIVTAGGSIGSLPVPIRENYSFDGWYTQSAGGDKVTDTTVVNGDMTLYAHWKGVIVDIYYEFGDGTDQYYHYTRRFGEPYGEMPELEWQGYNFEGWFTDAKGGEQVTSQSIINNPLNHSLYAHWTEAALPKGSKLTVNKVDYKVTDSGKVSVTANKDKKAKSISIAATVKYKNIAYKITEIKNGAYKNCTKLTKLTIGANIEKIGKNAFSGCSKLGKITIKANNLKSVGSGCFKGIKKGAKITIVCKNKKTYNKVVKMLKKAGTKNVTYAYKKG